MSQTPDELADTVASVGALPVPLGHAGVAGLSPEMRATIAAQLGKAKPARDDVLMAASEALRDMAGHDHQSVADIDWYCQNLAFWLVPRTRAVLRRLLDTEDERDALRARAAEFEALELGAIDGRVSATCDDPGHPTWLRAAEDTHACPWCRIAGLQADEPTACARCGCTEDEACDGGCVWQPNPLGLDLCSQCVTPDGGCTTPACGQIETPSMFGWILVDVAGSEQPARFHCSPWCAQRAIETIGSAMAADDLRAALTEKDTRDAHLASVGESTPLVVSRFDVVMEPAPEEAPVVTIGAVAEDGRPVALVLDAETRARVAAWLGHGDPPRAYLPRYDSGPAPLGWYSTPAAARAHCEASLSASHSADTSLVWDWIDDEDDGIAELVATIDGREEPTGYSVITLDLPAAYDPGADW
ncbi:hypothetical protein AB0903_31165 [Streptomyces sp. NPDC048389]|uniref:hypothetical protein n=1 Tax=Streptomyces sp. NPDC048389 TaxID=3154622 RepID=UPI003456D094